MRRHHLAVNVVRHLFESTLHVKFVLEIVHSQQNEFALTIEGIFDAVKRDEVRITEYRRHPWRLISDAILRRSSLESERLATDSLFFLPEAARVHRYYIMVPM